MRRVCTLLVVLCAHFAHARLVDTSVSSLDDDGDPDWLDKADQQGSVLAQKDIAAAESVTMGDLHHLVGKEVQGAKLDVDSSIDAVAAAKIHVVDSQRRADRLLRKAAVIGVRKDRLEHVLVEDRVRRNADRDAGLSGLGSERELEKEEATLRQKQKEFIDLQGEAKMAEDAAHAGSLELHENRLALTKAREDKEIADDLLDGARNDHKEAERAAKRASDKAKEAARIHYLATSPTAVSPIAPQPDDTERLGETNGLYQASDVAETDDEEAEVFMPSRPDATDDAVREALEGERAIENRDVSWAWAQKSKPPAQASQSNQPQLGEGAPAPVFKIRPGSSMAKITEASGIADALQAEVTSTLRVADENDPADKDVLETAKLLATIGKAVNGTMHAAREAVQRSEVHAAVNAPGLGQSIESSDQPQNPAVEEMIQRLQERVKAQALEIKQLQKKSGPFAAQHEADRWMSEWQKKENKESVKFDQQIVTVQRKREKEENQEEKAELWNEAQEVLEASEQDLDEATTNAKSLTQKYSAAAKALGTAIANIKEYTEKAERAQRDFEAYGPKMDAETIESSPQAQHSDTLRTEAEQQAQESLTFAHSYRDNNLYPAVERERQASLKMLEGLQEKIAAIQEQTDKKIKTVQAKCEAQKAVMTQCKYTEKRLDAVAVKKDCSSYSTWRAKLYNSTCRVDYMESQEQLKKEQQQLEVCKKQVRCAHTSEHKSTNSTAVATNSSAVARDVQQIELIEENSSISECVDVPEWSKDCMVLAKLGQCKNSAMLRAHCKASCQACN